MQPTRPTIRSATRTRGFSLTEMIVVISVIVLLIGITFPLLSGLQTGSRIEAGLNTVGMAVDVSRQYVAPSAWTEDSTDEIEGEQYSGTAALFCPTREIRIVVNHRRARNAQNVPLEELTGSNKADGYWDLEGVEYISIPYGVGVMGVQSNGTAVRYIAPPFAIAFNEFGHLSYGNVAGKIIYDGDGNGTYDIGKGRDNSYDPEQWDADSANATADIEQTLTKKLAFDAIECVGGLVVFDLDSFTETYPDALSNGGAVNLNSDEGAWLRENGKTVFFSPHTGSILRDEE